MPLLPNDPPRAAYVHVPFCRHRCGYCNFTLIAGRDDLIATYLTAIEKELSTLEQVYELDSLFLGGGTPTHLSVSQLQQLFNCFHAHFRFASQAEISVEANPLDLNAERVRVLREQGVNRVSLGVQSFRDAKLQLLERDHRAADIQRALDVTRTMEARLSLDLIFAAPGETLEDWQADLKAAIATGVGHISTYGLTIEPGSAFFGRTQRGQLPRVPELLEAAMYEQTISQLTAAGFEHYEVSNFAQPGERSVHNETYWRGRSYFAFGPGAARYVRGRREMNHRSTTTYLSRVLANQSPVAEMEMLSPVDRARERFVFGMRMLAGVEPSIFQNETGYDFRELFAEQISTCLTHGCMHWSAGYLQLTRKGLMISDSLWPQFLQE